MIRPEIDAVGQWKLEAPFSVDPTITYQCEAINGFQALEAQGIDVYERFYLPFGLSTSKYSEDKINNIDIVTLMSEGLDPVLVPTSFILEAPGVDAVDYKQFFLAIRLGALPGNISLDKLKTEIEDLVKTEVGIVPSVEEVVHPVAGTVSLAQHEQIEAARNSLKEITPSFKQRYEETAELLSRQAEKIKFLEEEIIRLNDYIG